MGPGNLPSVAARPTPRPTGPMTVSALLRPDPLGMNRVRAASRPICNTSDQATGPEVVVKVVEYVRVLQTLTRLTHSIAIPKEESRDSSPHYFFTSRKWRQIAIYNISSCWSAMRQEEMAPRWNQLHRNGAGQREVRTAPRGWKETREELSIKNVSAVAGGYV
ncbi:hypothetical protein BaRGS_00024784 [Batillaria attramentaria]|uniref:Uncharacterized protein n=1 Tax=Batillaria attramentaria TaxID=370345 RepID=A0ABD0K9Z2_9CAEN